MSTASAPQLWSAGSAGTVAPAEVQVFAKRLRDLAVQRSDLEVQLETFSSEQNFRRLNLRQLSRDTLVWTQLMRNLLWSDIWRYVEQRQVDVIFCCNGKTMME